MLDVMVVVGRSVDAAYARGIAVEAGKRGMRVALRRSGGSTVMMLVRQADQGRFYDLRMEAWRRGSIDRTDGR